MVETPLAAQATSCFCHAPRGHQKGKKLPGRAVKIVDIREAGQAQAGGKCAQRKNDGAQQRFLPQTEDVGTKPHNLSLYRDGAMRAIGRYRPLHCRGRQAPEGFTLKTGECADASLPPE